MDKMRRKKVYVYEKATCKKVAAPQNMARERKQFIILNTWGKKQKINL